MAHIALRKLTADLKESQTPDYTEIFNIEPVKVKQLTADGNIEEDLNLFHWTGTIYGPVDTPYAGGKFTVDIVIPDGYPNKPPLIKFTTKVYHPNIDKTGQICLNILRSPPNGDWKPSLNLPKTVLSIHSLLSDPNPNDPLNAESAKLYTENKELWEATAKEWTKIYGLN